MGLFDRNNREYAKIHIEFDTDKKEEVMMKVEGDEVSLASVIRALINNMLEEGFGRRILEFSVLKAFEDNKRNNIHVHKVHMSKKDKKEIAQMLEKILKEED